MGFGLKFQLFVWARLMVHFCGGTGGIGDYNNHPWRDEGATLVLPTRRHDVQSRQRLLGGWRRALQVRLAQLLGGHFEFLARLQELAEVQMPAEPVERCFGQQPEVCRQGGCRQRSL